MGVISTTMKLNIQFVAVPIAAPLVRIGRELISVGYTRISVHQPCKCLEDTEQSIAMDVSALG